MTKNCLYCGDPLSAKYPQKIYCSKKCSSAYRAERNRSLDQRSFEAKKNAGAVSELAVAVDLLNKGYLVFRALSPTCEFDLAIYKDGRFWRVEVKTSGRNNDGSARYVMKACQQSKHDILALYFPIGGKIEYKPSLETVISAP